MLTVKDIMTSKVIALAPSDDILSAVKILLDNKINGAPVVDDSGTVVGVLTQIDLVAQQKKLSIPSFFTLLDGLIPLSGDEVEKELTKINAVSVQDAMTVEPVTITPETTIEDAATIMANDKLYTLPVVDGGKLVGVVGKEDVLRTLLEK